MTVFLLLVAETLPTQSDSVPIIGRYTDISRYLWSYIECFIDSVTYTGGQPYGITTIKWHLREFDRYLLFLVVCSIAERNTVDFIDHYATKLNDQNSQYCLGTAETQEKEKCDFRGSHLKWSLPSHCHFDSFMQRGVSVKTIDISLKGIMPQNLPQQILQRIVRLSADGNSQREVARMLGVSQGCISKNFAMQPRDWSTTSEEAWRFDENLQATGRPSTAPNGQNELLNSSSANADVPPIWEADVSLNHSETASDHQILVSASSQMS